MSRNTPGSGARHQPSLSRLQPQPFVENDAQLDGEDDGHTTVDWTPASESLARQIDADRVSTLPSSRYYSC